MSARVEGDFAANVRRRMVDAGLTDAAVVSVGPESGAFGNTMAIFRVQQLLIRVVRDRGEDFLDIGCVELPGAFFQYDDVEIALGWRSVEDVLAKQAPEPLPTLLERVVRKLPELKTAFAPEHVGSTQDLLRAAEKARGEAFAARLRQ